MFKRFVFRYRDYFFAFALIVLGFATRLFMLYNPNQVVFDELHFGKFASAYFTGEYYFDIHPPLGKLLIALGAFLGGYGEYVSRYGVFLFQNIGQDYSLMPYIWFRLFPALAGGLIPVAVFCFLRAFRIKPSLSLLVGALLVFDNALLTQSRLILIDAFLILFGFWGLALFFSARHKGYCLSLFAAAGVFFALSFSVKWTGLSFYGLAGFVVLFDVLFRKEIKALRGQIFFKAFVAFVAIPFAVYFAIFAVHFFLLPHAGPGDAFMTSAFRQGELSFWHKFLELNTKMLFYNLTIKSGHPYGSSAWTWPVMWRPIYYWVQGQKETQSRIYLLGNPVLWYSAFVGLMIFLFFGGKVKLERSLKVFLAAAYFVNLVPFFSINRVLFLYHYFVSFIFSVIIFGLVFDAAIENYSFKARLLIISCLLLAVVFGFVFFAPLSYGLPLKDQAFQMRLWLPSWR